MPKMTDKDQKEAEALVVKTRKAFHRELLKFEKALIKEAKAVRYMDKKVKEDKTIVKTEYDDPILGVLNRLQNNSTTAYTAWCEYKHALKWLEKVKQWK